MRARSFALLAALALFGCGDDTETQPPPATGTTAVFDLSADTTDPAAFYDVPYPSDLRLDAEGHPDLSGFPNPQSVSTVTGLAAAAHQANGFSSLSVAFLRFSAALAPRAETDIIAADPSSPILLIDVDATSPERGRLIPVVAKTLEPDPYTVEHVLAVAARPGFILRPATRYAVVVMRSVNDEKGELLSVADVITRLRTHAPSGAAEEAADTLYTSLWETLDTLGVDSKEVAHATVFTTASTVAETAALGDAILDKYDVPITDLALDPDELYPELCVLRGSVEMPQFQEGTPPFDTQGFFAFDQDGLPIEQRKETAPVAIVIPRAPMPVGGYPLLLNVHGSGGFSIAMVRPVNDAGVPGDPIGPAFPYSTKGIAMAGMAMPVNPERLPNAEETAYLNVDNLPAMRDTFRQGVLEARLFLEAVKKLQIDPADLAACTGASLPPSETKFHFDPDHVGITGQSMGGMYTNMIAATEPSLKVAVPTGAGGHWTFFILETSLRDGQIPAFLTLLLGTTATLTHLHPVLAIGAAALEPADPIVYMPRVARMPLDGHPVRPIYEPVGQGDSYFPTVVYDAVALAYGHKQAGEVVWPEMQDALALEDLDGVLSLPVTNDLTSSTGELYTGAVLQFTSDGTYDPHAIYSHRDDVKRQYSCFVDSFFKTGTATIVAPTTDWTAACP
ncbi:MAG: hypothetical protein U0271_08675 [Polyangiaceae bacterium]